MSEAELAAQERAELDFQTAWAELEELERAMVEPAESQEGVAETPAEAARRERDENARWRRAVELLQAASRQQRRLTELQVESVMFDFHPAEDVRIPLSWKLTARQQRQIDLAWRNLVDGAYPHQPLAILDRYFQRVPVTHSASHP